MITIFNRREVLSTFDMKKQSEARQLLAQNGIDYDIKVINRKSPSPFSAGSRAYTGTFGERLEFEYEYTIYVKKSDYDKASYLLGTNRIF